MYGTDRDSNVDVWSWRTALAVAQEVRAGRLPQLILVIASRPISLVQEIRSAWRDHLNHEIERNFYELVTEAEVTGSYMLLKPLPAAARDRYILEVLRTKHNCTWAWPRTHK